MAVPRLRVPSASPGGSLRQAAGLSSDEVELYHRTYTTLLRSSGETHLRVLEPSHAAMNSSLHTLAASPESHLGAFMYPLRRPPPPPPPAPSWGFFLHAPPPPPPDFGRAQVVVRGQGAVAFRRYGY